MEEKLPSSTEVDKFADDKWRDRSGCDLDPLIDYQDRRVQKMLRAWLHAQEAGVKIAVGWLDLHPDPVMALTILAYNLTAAAD